jgi:hypothetical protein
MEHSFKKNNTCYVFMNEVRIKDEILPKPEEMVSLQVEGIRNVKMNENHLKKLHAQRTFWRGNNINELCWAFYCVNDNIKVNVITPQTMHCILWHNNPILNVNPKMQDKK